MNSSETSWQLSSENLSSSRWITQCWQSKPFSASSQRRSRTRYFATIHLATHASVSSIKRWIKKRISWYMVLMTTISYLVKSRLFLEWTVKMTKMQMRRPRLIKSSGPRNKTKYWLKTTKISPHLRKNLALLSLLNLLVVVKPTRTATTVRSFWSSKRALLIRPKRFHQIFLASKVGRTTNLSKTDL